MNDEKSMSRRANDIYGTILIIALVVIAMSWAAFIWEASTGVTTGSRRQLGQNSTPQHLAATRRNAIGATVVFGAVAAACLLARRSDS